MHRIEHIPHSAFNAKINSLLNSMNEISFIDHLGVITSLQPGTCVKVSNTSSCPATPTPHAPPYPLKKTARKKGLMEQPNKSFRWKYFHIRSVCRSTSGFGSVPWLFCTPKHGGRQVPSKLMCFNPFASVSVVVYNYVCYAFGVVVHFSFYLNG